MTVQMVRLRESQSQSPVLPYVDMYEALTMAAAVALYMGQKYSVGARNSVIIMDLQESKPKNAHQRRLLPFVHMEVPQ
jgi:hypothetical protein